MFSFDFSVVCIPGRGSRGRGGVRGEGEVTGVHRGLSGAEAFSEHQFTRAFSLTLNRPCQEGK